MINILKKIILNGKHAGVPFKCKAVRSLLYKVVSCLKSNMKVARAATFRGNDFEASVLDQWSGSSVCGTLTIQDYYNRNTLILA